MPDGPKVLVIPDTQVRPDQPSYVTYCTAIGNYIGAKRPDVVVHLGDHWDLPSLSQYEPKGHREHEGRRYADDVHAGNEGAKLIHRGYRRFRSYHPIRKWLFGNHEDRIARVVAQDPRWEGRISLDDLVTPPGWDRVPYLKPWTFEGVQFAHYFYAPNTGRPYGGSADNVLTKTGRSYVMGHRQGLYPSTIRHHPDGTQSRGLIAGSCYDYHQPYKGPQASDYWRGLVMLHGVSQGSWSQCEVELRWLIENYG